MCIIPFSCKDTNKVFRAVIEMVYNLGGLIIQQAVLYCNYQNNQGHSFLKKHYVLNHHLKLIFSLPMAGDIHSTSFISEHGNGLTLEGYPP